MTPKTSQVDANVDISADVVRRLGEELFASSSQALLELVKNSYDADAGRVRVTIKREVHSRRDPSLTGRLTVADDGFGMTRDVIENAWLVLSASPKREQKRRGTPTKGGRTPLGDKGLGRLGAQLLGDQLTIRTRPKPTGRAQRPTVEHRVTLDFREFTEDRRLGEIKPHWEETRSPDPDDWPGPGKWGTILTVQGLRDPGSWAEASRLEQELSRALNPFEGVEKFRLGVELDGHRVPIDRVGRDVRRAALSRWKVKYTGTRLQISGVMRPEWFRVRGSERQELLERAITRRPQALVRRLQKNPRLAPYQPAAGRGPYVVRFSLRIPTEEVGDLPSVTPDCGPFTLEVDQVARQLSVARGASLAAFANQSEYADWVKDRIGVRVYRDGFLVAGEYDLLRLGGRFTSGGSYYGLRPQNVLGYVAIGAEANPDLQEATDREGFRSTPAFSRFDALLQYTTEQINRILDDAGREASDWAKDLEEKAAGNGAIDADRAVEQAQAVTAASQKAREQVMSSQRAVREVREENPELPGDVSSALEDANEALGEAREALDTAAGFAAGTVGLRNQLERRQEENEDLVATVALGLVAEAVAHEVTHVIQRLQERARLAKPLVDKLEPPEPGLRLLVTEVESAAAALRGQLRHLDPQLRGRRTRRRNVQLGKLVKQSAAYHRDRLAASRIAVETKVKSPATVWASPGRLSQVVDNLIINSEYWILQGADRSRSRAGTITITVDGAVISVADTGPGVPERLADSVFEAFVTQRAGGRGLGLFVSRQLLDLDNGKLALAARDDGRLARFVIDLSEARGRSE